MEKFCLITNTEKDKDYFFANKIKDFLIKKGKTCFIMKDLVEQELGEDIYTDVSKIPPDTECAIVLGGDGTIIQAANDLIRKDIPIFGVNSGTLGFLTEVEKSNMPAAFEKIFKDEYHIDNRMMLRGDIVKQGEMTYQSFALNDIVVCKRGLCRIVDIKVYVNDELFDTYYGDGVIVSTPTGSTAYNLSAGGPVVVPSMEAIVITPICPHSLNNRSLVLSSKDKITVEIGKSKRTQIDEAYAIYDGKRIKELETKDKICIEMPEERTKIVRLNNNSFFEILRNKL